MADVTIKCPQCGKQVTVSEFVDPESLTCSECEAKLGMPKSTAPRQRPITTVLRPAEKKADPAQQKPLDPARQKLIDKSTRKARKKSRKLAKGKPKSATDQSVWRMRQYILSWVMFVILALILCSFRWGSFLTKDAAATFKEYGMIGFAVLSLVVIIDAFSEDMFEGLLCLFIPGYLLYYLFAKSDSFFLRALVAAFGLSSGLDAYILSAKHITAFVIKATDWISSGGGG